MKKLFLFSLVGVFLIAGIVQIGVASVKVEKKKPLTVQKSPVPAYKSQFSNESTTADTLVFYDFESGEQGFIGVDLTDHPPYWHVDAFNAYGGSGLSYWCAIEGREGYDNSWYQWLETPVIDLREAASSVELRFMQWVDYEAEEEETGTGWDAANVRISTDGGATFEVLNPDYPEYDADSCAAFQIFNEAPDGGYPGWSGEKDMWEEVAVDLAAYVGQEVIIRFVFASDWATSTLNTPIRPGLNLDAYTMSPNMWGYFVDEITVEDAITTRFFDDGGDTGQAQMIAGSRNMGPYGPVYTTEDAYSPTHSWHFDSDNLAISKDSQGSSNADMYWIETPWVELGDQYCEATFYIRIDLPDGDGDDDGFFDDSFQGYATADRREWTQVAIGGSDTTSGWPGPYWTLWHKNLSARQAGLDLADYFGESVKLAWMGFADDNDDGGDGSGIWVDDVTITCRDQVPVDVGIDDVVVPFPHSVNFETPVTGYIRNFGSEDAAAVIAWSYVTDADGNKVTGDQPTGPPWPAIPSGETLPWVFNYTPQDTGLYRVYFYQFVPDYYPPNDSGYSPLFRVYPEKEGYMAHHHYSANSGYSADGGGGPAVLFDPPTSTRPFNIESLEIYLDGTGDVKFYVYEASGSNDTIPDDGTLLWESDILNIPDHDETTYFGWNVEGVAELEEIGGPFFLFIEMQEGNELYWRGGGTDYLPTNSFIWDVDDEEWVHTESDYIIRSYIKWGLGGGACEGLRGDAKEDGNINVLDVLEVANHILGNLVLEGDALCRGDCSGDALINIIDALQIANVILGLIEGCPGGGVCKPVITSETMEFMRTLESYLSPDEFEQIMTLIKNEIGVPREFSLAQNYPNPFNPSTTIEYTVAGNIHTELTVYNVLGQEVASLVDEMKTDGVYTVEWDAADLASGIYFYRLTAGDYTATRQMVLMK